MFAGYAGDQWHDEQTRLIPFKISVKAKQLGRIVKSKFQCKVLSWVNRFW